MIDVKYKVCNLCSYSCMCQYVVCIFKVFWRPDDDAAKDSETYVIKEKINKTSRTQKLL